MTPFQQHYGSQNIDLKPLRDAAFKNLAKKISEEIKQTLQPVWDKLQVCLVGGGGGSALYEYLSIDKKQLVSQPQFGNASGFRKAAEAVIRKSRSSNGQAL